MLNTTSPSEPSVFDGAASRLSSLVRKPSLFLNWILEKKLFPVASILLMKFTGLWKLVAILLPGPPRTEKFSTMVKELSSLIWFSVVLPVTALIIVLPM